MDTVNVDRNSVKAKDGLAIHQAACQPEVLSGGVHKGSDFVNGEVPFSPEKSEGGVHKVEGKVNELSENKKQTPVAQVARRSSGRSGADDREALALPAPAPCGQLGRPKTITQPVFEQLCMLLSVGFSRRQAAAYLGFSHTAIANAAARHPEMKEELERAESLSDLQPEVTLMAAARKNWRAAAWYLTFRAKNPRPRTEQEQEDQRSAECAEERRHAEQNTTRQNTTKMNTMSEKEDSSSASAARQLAERLWEAATRLADKGANPEK